MKIKTRHFNYHGILILSWTGHRANELSFDLSLTFPQYILLVKRSLGSNSAHFKFYVPGIQGNVCKNVRGHYRIKTLPKSSGISYGTTPPGHVHTGTTDRTPLPRARPWADTPVCRWMTIIVLCQLNVWFDWKKAQI